MHKARATFAMFVPVVALGLSFQAQPVNPTPQYQVSFVRGKPTSGMSGGSVLKLPFQCTGDGTIFVSFVSTAPSKAGQPPPPPGLPPMLLTAIPREGPGQTFRTDQIPELYVSGERDHFVYDSGVAILVTASRENKPVKYSYAVGSYHGEATRNSAEQQTYLLTFNRKGEFLRAEKLTNAFYVEKIAVFPSGKLLAFGFDEKGHSPKLAMLQEDGSLLKFLELSGDEAPASAVSGAEGPRPHSVAPSELVALGRTIILVQNQSSYPLLEVTEGGAMRMIHAKLPKGSQVQGLIPSDRDLYVIGGADDGREGAQLIYEVDPANGGVLRTIGLSGPKVAADSVACVSDGKFLSIEYGEGDVIPLVGSPEADTSKKEPGR